MLTVRPLALLPAAGHNRHHASALDAQLTTRCSARSRRSGMVSRVIQAGLASLASLRRKGGLVQGPVIR
jgi:hypothetical protein